MRPPKEKYPSDFHPRYKIKFKECKSASDMVEKVKSIFDGNKTWARLCLLLWIDGFLLTFDEWRIATAHPRDSLSPDVAAYVNTSDAISLFYVGMLMNVLP